MDGERLNETHRTANSYSTGYRYFYQSKYQDNQEVQWKFILKAFEINRNVMVTDIAGFVGTLFGIVSWHDLVYGSVFKNTDRMNTYSNGVRYFYWSKYQNNLNEMSNVVVQTYVAIPRIKISVHLWWRAQEFWIMARDQGMMSHKKTRKRIWKSCHQINRLVKERNCEMAIFARALQCCTQIGYPILWLRNGHCQINMRTGIECRSPATSVDDFGHPLVCCNVFSASCTNKLWSIPSFTASKVNIIHWENGIRCKRGNVFGSSAKTSCGRRVWNVWMCTKCTQGFYIFHALQEWIPCLAECRHTPWTWITKAGHWCSSDLSMLVIRLCFWFVHTVYVAFFRNLG